MGMSDWDYSIASGSPTENFTTSGAEVSVVYIGPSSNRVAFIKDVFGAWRVYTTNVGTTEEPKYVQCAQQYPQVTPYADLSSLAANGACVGPYCLYPDTFSGKPLDDNSMPNVWSDPDCTVTNDLLRPIVDTCAWEYTVNYRYRNHARLPKMLEQDPAIFANPPIPTGTYTDVRAVASTEWMSLEGRQWKYQPDSFGSYTWDFCAACKNKQSATVLKNADNVNLPDATQINSVELEVTWDNVPLPPWDIIRRANGCVNEHPIFGYPIGAVKFEFSEPEIIGYYGCLEVYRLRYIFKVKTAPVTVHDDNTFNFSGSNGEIVNGMVGLWNRRWCPCPIQFGGVMTHWVPLRAITDESVADCAGEDSVANTHPVQSFPLHMLFAMNVCDCTPLEISGGSCTESFVDFAVESSVPDQRTWLFPNLAQPTAVAYAAAGIGSVV